MTAAPRTASVEGSDMAAAEPSPEPAVTLPLWPPAIIVEDWVKRLPPLALRLHEIVFVLEPQRVRRWRRD